VPHIYDISHLRVNKGKIGTQWMNGIDNAQRAHCYDSYKFIVFNYNQ
jgi:hypothetical protein